MGTVTPHRQKRNGVDRVDDDLPDARALDDHVGLEADARECAGVVGGPEGTNDLRLRT